MYSSQYVAAMATSAKLTHRTEFAMTICCARITHDTPMYRDGAAKVGGEGM